MRFIFSPSFSYELMAQGHLTSVVDLEDQLNVFFETRTYGQRLTTIYCGLICVSQEFDQYFRVRRPKWSRKHPALEVEVMVDFTTYCSLAGNRADRLRCMGLACYKTIQVALDLKLLEGFDKERFLTDLKSCFTRDGLPLG